MKARRVDFSPDEWLQGTRRLDNATRGLYITICALIYSIGGPVDPEDVRAVCRDHGNAINRQLEKLIALGKLEIIDGKLMNKRCGIELENVEKRSANARESANNRWGNVTQFPTNRMIINDTDDATAMHARSNATHQPSTTTTSINPQTPLERGLRRNGRNADPYHIDGLSTNDILRRYRATTDKAEKAYLRDKLGFPPLQE